MKTWVIHAPGSVRNDKWEPLCMQVTGHGSRGCDQALVADVNSKVTCAKCLRIAAKAVGQNPSVCVEMLTDGTFKVTDRDGWSVYFKKAEAKKLWLALTAFNSAGAFDAP